MRTSHRLAVSLAVAGLFAAAVGSFAASPFADAWLGEDRGALARTSLAASQNEGASQASGPATDAEQPRPRVRAGGSALTAANVPRARRQLLHEALERSARRVSPNAGDPIDPSDSTASDPGAPEWPAPAPVRLILDPLRVASDGLSLEVTGYDKRGPRELALWRLYEGSAAVVARGRSRRDGSLEFPRLVAPHTGLVLVATPAWETPDGPRASPAQSVAARAPVGRSLVGGGRRGWTPR